MVQNSVKTRRFHIWLPLAAIAPAFALVFVGGSRSLAQDPSSQVVARVEEDWDLKIGIPEPINDAPQIVNVISPSPSLDGWHGVFELNHQTLPDYSAGGMCLQIWNGDCNRDFRVSQSVQVLATEQENLSYTLALSIEEGVFRLSVLNGRSQTWGQFGGGDSWQLAVPTTVTNLNDYSPFTSLSHSRIAFSANRVETFTLKTVRFYDADGNLLNTLREDELTPTTTNVDDGSVPDN